MDYLRNPIMKKKMFLVLTSGKILKAQGSGIGTGSIFCLSFSLSNRVCYFLSCFHEVAAELPDGLFWHYLQSALRAWLFLKISLVVDNAANLLSCPETILHGNSSGLAHGCFSLNVQNRKNDTSLFSFRNIKILKNMQKKNADSLDCN